MTHQCFLCDRWRAEDGQRLCPSCHRLVTGDAQDISCLTMIAQGVVTIVMVVAICCCVLMPLRALVTVHAEAHGMTAHPWDFFHCEACRRFDGSIVKPEPPKEPK